MFMWLLTQGRIQCRTVLHRKHVLPNATCEQEETPEHVIGGCSIGMQFGEKLGMNAMTGTTVDNIHRFSPPAGVPNEEYSSPWLGGNYGKQEMQQSSKMNGKTSHKFWQPAKQQRSNGAAGFLGRRGTSWTNGARFFNHQDKDEQIYFDLIT